MSLELNKIAAAVLTAGVVAMGSGFVANLLVGGGKHGGEHENAYPIQVADSGGAAPAQEEEQGLEPVLPLMASADPAAGENLTRACAACHSFDKGGANKVGPNLWDIVGADHAHLDNFAYSDVLVSMKGQDWTYEALNAFLENPREYAPGTKMSYGGMARVQDRANLIAYMRTMSDDPVPLPTEEEIAAVTGGGEEAAAEAPAAEEPAAQEPAAQEPAAQEPAAEPAAEAEAAAEGEAQAEGAPGQAQQAAEAAQEAVQEAAQEAVQQVEQAADAAPAAAISEEARPVEQTMAAAPEAPAETQQAAAPAGDLPPYLQMIAAADPAAGERQVRACAACHSFDQGGPNKVGPNLWDTVGKPIAHLDNYNYSQVFRDMHEKGMTWTYENLWAYLKNPREWAPGTKMAYAGVRKEEDKAAIIAYLRSLSESPAPLEPLN